MDTQKHFLDHPEIREYQLQGKTIRLDLPPGVFPPSPFVLPFAEHIKIYPGERVADIGTGSGILAIMAAKLGGEVWATDISKEAIANTEQNALKNHVNIVTCHGSFLLQRKSFFSKARG